MSKESIITHDQLPADVIDAIRAGRKVEAIKLLREEKGLGLANAKVLVDRAWATHGPQKEVLNFADTAPGAGNFARSLTVLLVLAAAYFFYFSG